jgi:hypothetical protein
MRYDCDDPAFAGDFIEFSDSFSRGQQRALWAAASEDEALFLDILRPKILRLHLSCVEAEAITDPDDLTPERTLAMDVRLYTWFGYVWVVHLRGLSELGKACGLKLLDTYAMGAPVATTEAVPASQNHS